MQMAAQVGPAMNLNLQAFMEEVLRSYGFQDTSRFFSHNPAAPGGTGAQGEAQGAQGIIDQNARPSITQGPQSGQTNAALAGAHGLSQAPDQLAAMGIRSVQGLSG
jgi:hypothetical protein